MDEEYNENEFRDDYDDEPDRENDIDITNSLALAAEITRPSEVLNNFPELTKEQRNAFLKDDQVKELRYRHRCYINFKYITKILKLQKKEDLMMLENRRSIFDIENEEDLKEYFRNNYKSYIYSNLLKEYDVNVLLNDIKSVERDCIDEDIFRVTEKINSMYDEYRDEANTPEYIDDPGNLAVMQAESILSSGRGGNERLAGITSIDATRNIDIKEKIKTQTNYSNPVKSLLRKFR